MRYVQKCELNAICDESPIGSDRVTLVATYLVHQISFESTHCIVKYPEAQSHNILIRYPELKENRRLWTRHKIPRRPISNRFVTLLKLRDSLKELLPTDPHYRLGRLPPVRDIRPLRPRRRFMPVTCG